MLIKHFKPILYIILVSCVFATCEKDETLKSLPECVKDEIIKIESEPVSNPPGSIWQYQYKGKTVYFIPSKCCDIPSRLIDSDCRLICNPDGGFVGTGDGKCTDFFSERTGEKLIWKDNRKL